MDQEIVLVVSLVRDLELTERHIAYRRIEETVWKIGFLKSLHGNTGVLIELSCYPAGNTVELNTVKLCGVHTVRDKSHEVTDTAGRFQYVPGFEVHVFKCLIHRLDNDRRRVERRQSGFTRRFILILRKQFFQLQIVRIVLFEEIRQTAPTDILGQYVLFIGLCQSVFALQLFQKLNSAFVVVEPFKRCSCTDVITVDLEVRAIVRMNFGVQNIRSNLSFFGRYRGRGKGDLAVFRIQQSICVGVHYDLSVFNGTDWELIKFFIRKRLITLNQR